MFIYNMMMPLYYILLLLLFIFYLVYLFCSRTVDNYSTVDAQGNTYYVTYPKYSSWNYPFWNTQLGTKRGMSYDLRGDIPIPYYTNLPWNMSTRIPIVNKPLYLVS